MDGNGETDRANLAAVLSSASQDHTLPSGTPSTILFRKKGLCEANCSRRSHKHVKILGFAIKS